MFFGLRSLSMTFAYLLTLLSQFMADYSERLQARALSPISFQSTPQLTNRHWDLLQRLDERTIMLVFTPMASTNGRELIAALEPRLRPEDNLYDFIMRAPERNLVASRDLISVYVPSQAFIKQMDTDKTKSVAELRAEIHTWARDYMKAVLDGFDGCYTAENALEICQGFYLLSALDKPWGPGAHFKCSCQDCFRDGTCHHSLMLSLLCKDPEPLLMPAQYRTRGVPSRKRKRGRPSSRTAGVLGDRKAMNLDSDEDEEELALKV